MKRFSTWAAILGIILLTSSLVGLGTTIANPTDMMDVNVVMFITGIAWTAFGGFLLFCYFLWRPREDALKAVGEGAADSKEVLTRSRNTVLGFVLLITALGSLEAWLLNDYTAGLTLVNITVIFDLAALLVLLYCTVELFRNKRDISKFLLVVVLIYSFVEGLLLWVRGFWFGPVVNLLFAVYFAFALMMPLTRRNHRIAHLVLLPIAIASILAWGEFDNGNLQPLSEEYALREEQFAQDSGVLQGAYNIFLQKENPSVTDIASVRDAVAKREVRIQELYASISALEAEYQKHMPSVAQRKELEGYVYLRQLLALHQEQAQALDEFMEYAGTVNLANPSAAQAERILAYKNRVDEIGMKLTEVDFALANANLETD